MSSKPTTSLSIHHQLAQSLTSNDVKLLETCLGNTDTDLIDATIAHLSVLQIIPLLNAIVERFERNAQRAPALLKWIRAVVVQQSAYLASTKELQRKIQDVHTILQERAKPLQTLEKLRGRLELVMGQGELRRKLMEQQKQATIDAMVDIDEIESEDNSGDSEDETASEEEHDAGKVPNGVHAENVEDVDMDDDSREEVVEH